jgi:hypothetical protein
MRPPAVPSARAGFIGRARFVPFVGSALCAFAYALTTPAHAQDEMRAQAEQRVQLAARLIADSPAAQRVVASGHAPAVAHLDEGRLHLSSARDALAAGHYEQARKAADEALHHLGMARRLVPDEPARQQALRQRHAQQLASVERLVEAWRVRASPRIDDSLIEATGLVGQARRLGEEQRYDEGLRMLDAAEQRVLGGLMRALPSGEIDYTQRPEDATAAFAHEMGGYSALAELVPVALRELSPSAQAQALVERYMRLAHALHAQAQQRFEAGDAQGALASLRKAVIEVQRALAAAGVVTPPPATGGTS